MCVAEEGTEEEEGGVIRRYKFREPQPEVWETIKRTTADPSILSKLQKVDPKLINNQHMIY